MNLRLNLTFTYGNHPSLELLYYIMNIEGRRLGYFKQVGWGWEHSQLKSILKLGMGGARDQWRGQVLKGRVIFFLFGALTLLDIMQLH